MVPDRRATARPEEVWGRAVRAAAREKAAAARAAGVKDKGKGKGKGKGLVTAGEEESAPVEPAIQNGTTTGAVETDRLRALIKKGGVKMPGFDGSGPMGRGPMTGGGFGNCGGRTDYRGGYGMGYGMGRGRGFRGGGRGGVARFGGAGWGYYPADYQDPQYERASLQSLTDQLRAELAALERRMGELEQRET